MLSPIQIKHHWIRRMDLTSLREPVAESNYTFQFLLQHQQIEKLWHVVLGVKFMAAEAAESNYEGTIEMEGAFEIHPDFPAEKLEELVRMNGGALLYGAAREMVIMLTSRCKNGPLDLPSVDARMFLTMQPVTASESSLTKES
jgi:preprotein translocase subunit SecB